MIIDFIQRAFGIGRWKHAYGGVPRSPEWPKVRAAHLLKEPNCQVCGGSSNLNVHHILPFHIDKSLELNPDNLITLCNGSSKTIACHIRFGHFDSFKDKYNPKIREEAPIWNKRFMAKTEAETGVGN